MVNISRINLSNKDVVIIDDNSTILGLMEETLNQEGYRTHSFLSPEKAISFIRKNHHLLHLVITDFEMPVLSGIQLVETIREFNYQLPIIISSGHQVDITDLSIKGQINTHLLRKPYRQKALQNSINHAVC